MDHIAAVLTGDLINSTKAGPAATDRTMAVLAGAAATLSDWVGADTLFTRYRGDGWQIYVDRPGLVMRASLFVAATLRAAEPGLGTRIAVGLGGAIRPGGQDLADASGEAFTNSGHALDHMPRNRRMMLMPSAPMVPEWQSAMFHMADLQARFWSRPQAEAVALALDKDIPTLESIAQRVGITRQAMQARLNGACFDGLKAFADAFERHTFTQAPPP